MLQFLYHLHMYECFDPPHVYSSLTIQHTYFCDGVKSSVYGMFAQAGRDSG